MGRGVNETKALAPNTMDYGKNVKVFGKTSFVLSY